MLGLGFLRLPAQVTLTLAAIITVQPYYVRFEIFELPLMRFIGLGYTIPVTADFEPLFPWFGAFLFGMALARIMAQSGWLRPVRGTALLRRLGWPGRNSLWVYLAHQPVLIGLLWLWAKANGQI